MGRYLIWNELYKGTWVIKKEFITLGELKKMFHMFSNSIDWEIIGKDEIRFKKRIKYLIQLINGYYVENKYDLIWQRYFMF